jgi:two-component system OmpR family sensor kinase
VRRGPGESTILVGVPVWRVDADLRMLGWQLVGAGALVLAVGLIGGAVVSSRIFRPLAAISETASRISGDNLAERIDPARIDTELAGLANVLNATFDRLQEAFDRQARFTADASHELRTPLAVIRSQAELALLRPRSPEEYREALASCARASQRMAAIVEDLLILARADASRLELREQPVPLEAVVQEAVALIEPLAREKGLRLEAELAPATVSGDAEALARVAGTLLSNAVAYNRANGSVRVTLAVEGGEAVLSVEDSGVGIGAADLPHLFERFYRVGEDRSRATGGTGLGLAICKAMVEAQGGTVSVTSEPGTGSTFRVRLPLA